MSLKDTIVFWSQGVDKALEGKFQEAVDIWTGMQEPGARIYFNIASMHILLGNLEEAETNLKFAVGKDPHLAIGYFQKGIIALKRQRFKDAMEDLELAKKNLRGNLLIDYKQLGLQYKLYSCEVMFNHAYGLYRMNKQAEAREELELAKSSASNTSESRHKIIVTALENMRLGTMFQLYELPDKAMIFQPPRNKTEVLKPINFLGKAKVLSSVVDQDSYVGFVGVQEEKQRKTPSGVNPPASNKSSSSQLTSSTSSNSGKPPKPVTPSPSLSRSPRPDAPPPAPSMKIQNRKASLHHKKAALEFHKANVKGRPPKPNSAPPPRSAAKPTKSTEVGVAKANSKPLIKMTVKVHYTSTRALRVSPSILYPEFQALICKKFDCPEDSITLWCKKKCGSLKEINNEESLKVVTNSLDDGYRITLWAYDKHETDSEEEGEVPVLMNCEAIHDYIGHYEDELSFKSGEQIEITADIDDQWYEGRCNGVLGIFPKSFAKQVV